MSNSITKGDLDHQPEEEKTVSSQNHGLTQLRIGAQLFHLSDQYNVATQLSLDVSSPERQQILSQCKVKAERELKPDIVLYYAKDFDYIDPTEDLDVVRVEQMPLLCVEIVSPTQTSQDILPKLRAYFALGVKSCWYVDPNLKLIQVYSSPKESKTFVTLEDVFDQVLEIRLPLSKIFSKRYKQNQESKA